MSLTQKATPPPPNKMLFTVTILGAGSASPVLARHPTAQLITYENDSFLIDCGEGTQYRLLQQRFRPSRLRAIFISHLHGDHYFGLVPLLSSLNMGGRKDSLRLFGPAGLKEIIDLQLQLAATSLNFKLIFEETNTQKQYELFDNKYLTIQTIPLKHRIPCAGFLFREKPQKHNIIKDKLPENIDFEIIKQLKEGKNVTDESGKVLYDFTEYTTPPLSQRSYAFCSDTRFEPYIADLVKNVNLLYHEATFADNLAHQAYDRFHATAREAAKIATLASAKKLLIGHFSSRYKTFDDFLEQARSEFPDTEIAEEGKTFEV